MTEQAAYLVARSQKLRRGASRPRCAAEREEFAQLLAAAVEKERQAQAVSDRINRNRVALGRVFKAAAEFQRRVDALAGKPLTPAAS